MRILFSTLCLTAVAAASATASPIPFVDVIASNASAGGTISGSCSGGASVSGPVSANFGGSGAGCEDNATASVGGGFIGAATSVALFPGNGSTGYGTRASASVTYDFNLGVTESYVYNGPELVTINLEFSGTSVGFFDDAFRSLFSTGASALVSGFATLTGSTNNIDLQRDREEFNVSAAISRRTADPDSDGTSTEENRSFALSIVTDPRRTLRVTLGLSAAAGATGPNSATVRASADGSQTLNFASDRPVFEVSDGLIADFEDVNIFGNRWVDPRAPDPMSPVPLPAGLPLLLGALGLLGVIRRKTT